MECQLDEAGTKEWRECWAMPLEWVDMAMLVSMVELMGDLEIDMPKWVEEMKEVLVWISNIRSRLWHVELRTKLRSKLRP